MSKMVANNAEKPVKGAENARCKMVRKYVFRKFGLSIGRIEGDGRKRTQGGRREGEGVQP